MEGSRLNLSILISLITSILLSLIIIPSRFGWEDHRGVLARAA